MIQNGFQPKRTWKGKRRIWKWKGKRNKKEKMVMNLRLAV